MDYTFCGKKIFFSFSLVLSYIDGNPTAKLPVSIVILVLEGFKLKKEGLILPKQAFGDTTIQGKVYLNLYSVQMCVLSHNLNESLILIFKK